CGSCDAGSTCSTEGQCVCAGESCEIQISMATGLLPDEVSWNLIDSTGASVAAGSGYTADYTTYDSTVLLTSGSYTLKMYDAFGDGWNLGTITLSYVTSGDIIASGGLATGGSGSLSVVIDCPLCAPSCDGADCGGDGCGGTCGSCDTWGAGFTCSTEGQCISATCVGDLVVTDGAGLDALTGCKKLTGGGLTLISDSLTNVDALHALEEIQGGGLFIQSSQQLLDLDGLMALKSVGGALYVSNNPLLASTAGLSSLQSVVGDLFITYNDALTTLGMTALQSVGANITIANNAALCQSLVDDLVMASGISIGGMPDYYTGNDGPCDGCTTGSCDPSFYCAADGTCQPGCTGDYIISGTDAATAIYDVYPCGVIVGDLTLSDTGLTSLELLNGLTQVTGDLSIHQNHSLTTLSGLGGLLEVGGELSIKNNNNLKALDLDGLEIILGDLVITGHPLLCQELIHDFATGLTIDGDEYIDQANDGDCAEF
ncbi:MAG: hypothetical protein QF464_15280, partial [Myxococcota bacterium]|nr:hypothetical protein [Myxococcota bacterium]